jgi:hypothetical protein
MVIATGCCCSMADSYGSASGNAVPVAVQVNGVSSQAGVTIAVKQ